MSINTSLLEKGLKRLLVLLFLLIASPITLNIGFKALSKYSEESIWIAYIILALATVLIITTIVMGIKIFKTLLDALFNT